MDKKRVAVPSKEELEELLSKYTQAEVAERLGSCQTTVASWKKALGITVNRGPKPVPEGFVEYAENHNREDTAAHFGLTYGKVRVLERKAGVRCVRKSSCELESLEDLDVLLKYFSRKEIAERFGVSQAAVGKWVEKSGQFNKKI